MVSIYSRETHVQCVHECNESQSVSFTATQGIGYEMPLGYHQTHACIPETLLARLLLHLVSIAGTDYLQVHSTTPNSTPMQACFAGRCCHLTFSASLAPPSHHHQPHFDPTRALGHFWLHTEPNKAGDAILAIPHRPPSVELLVHRLYLHYCEAKAPDVHLLPHRDAWKLRVAGWA